VKLRSLWPVGARRLVRVYCWMDWMILRYVAVIWAGGMCSAPKADAAFSLSLPSSHSAASIFHCSRVSLEASSRSCLVSSAVFFRRSASIPKIPVMTATAAPPEAPIRRDNKGSMIHVVLSFVGGVLGYLAARRPTRRLLLKFFPNVQVHTPLPASASDETEVKP
jgi:hypothetical protein